MDYEERDEELDRARQQDYAMGDAYYADTFGEQIPSDRSAEDTAMDDEPAGDLNSHDTDMESMGGDAGEQSEPSAQAMPIRGNQGFGESLDSDDAFEDDSESSEGEGQEKPSNQSGDSFIDKAKDMFSDHDGR